jgi:hypothetical protein
VFHGGRRVCQSDAYTVAPSGVGREIDRARIAIVEERALHVLPPSVERYTPRVSFGPYPWPSAATSNVRGSFGSTRMRPI